MGHLCLNGPKLFSMLIIVSVIKDVNIQTHLYCKQKQVGFLSLQQAYFMSTKSTLKFSYLCYCTGGE